MTEEMMANSIIVVGFLSSLVFLFTAAATTAFAWFRIGSRVDELSQRTAALGNDLAVMNNEFVTFKGELAGLRRELGDQAELVSGLVKTVDSNSIRIGQILDILEVKTGAKLIKRTIRSGSLCV